MLVVSCLQQHSSSSSSKLDAAGIAAADRRVAVARGACGGRCLVRPCECVQPAPQQFRVTLCSRLSALPQCANCLLQPCT